MKFVVHTQFLENYGAHAGKGTFAAGEAYWKMKGGNTFIVEDLDRIQDAVAFVAAREMYNGIGAKEFPVEWETYDEWFAREIAAEDSEDYREFKLEQARVITPKQPKENRRLVDVLVDREAEAHGY